jgi:hypothetical protein
MPETNPEILCITHDFIADSHDPDGTARGHIIVGLNNGRALVMDDFGVTDLGDFETERQSPEKPVYHGFVSWAELLEMLDKFRAEQMN